MGGSSVDAPVGLPAWECDSSQKMYLGSSESEISCALDLLVHPALGMAPASRASSARESQHHTGYITLTHNLKINSNRESQHHTGVLELGLGLGLVLQRELAPHGSVSTLFETSMMLAAVL